MKKQNYYKKLISKETLKSNQSYKNGVNSPHFFTKNKPYPKKR